MDAQYTHQYIQELDDPFLTLFPHRWDYLWADHGHPGDRAAWHTESSHPLSDRQIQSGDRLYGVRFAPQTEYFMLDIDPGSPYHPQNDPLAVDRIRDALEFLGITSDIAVSSSYRRGIHLYFPLAESCKSWELASVVAYRLNRVGFIVEDGILEIFPNARNYDDERIALFKGHRLPLQQGSYMLDKSWNLKFSSRESFASAWAICQFKNQINPVVFDRLLADSKRKIRKLSFKASKFLADLETDISQGWTSHGQTNFILGRITLKEYIFGGWLSGKSPLTGDQLIAAIIRTATTLPGYKEWCQHQHDLVERAQEWARSIENSRYYPYRNDKKPKTLEQSTDRPPISWNQWQQQRARDRLCFAIADLLNRGNLPAGAAGRCQILTKEYGFSATTLYSHRDLWHPDHLWKSPPDPPELSKPEGACCSEGAQAPSAGQSLLPLTGCNASQDKGLDAFIEWANSVTGCNASQDKGLDAFIEQKLPGLEDTPPHD